MPKIARRSKTAYSSPIRRLTPFANAAKSKGIKVFHLNIGQPDIITPPDALKKLKDTEIAVLAYSPSAGFQSLRQKFAIYYNSMTSGITSDHILVTNGASEALYFAFMACLDKQDELIVPEPYYANYMGFAQNAGVKVVPITTRIEEAFDLPELSDFEAVITRRSKAILLCNPGNPTGRLYSEEKLRALAALAKKHDLYLIVDEVYREFIYDDEKSFFSALNLAGMEEHVIVIDSISKRYSACGARVGMIVSRNMSVLKVMNQYAEVRLSPPSLGQILAEHLVDVPATYFQAVKETYKKRRDTMVKHLNSMPGVVSYVPEGAFYCFVQLPIDDADRFCQWLLESYSHDNQTVMLAPGTGFYVTPGMGRQEVRIAYVLEENELEKAMICLEGALKAYNRKDV